MAKSVFPAVLLFLSFSGKCNKVTLEWLISSFLGSYIYELYRPEKIPDQNDLFSLLKRKLKSHQIPDPEDLAVLHRNLYRHVKSGRVLLSEINEFKCARMVYDENNSTVDPTPSYGPWRNWDFSRR